MDISFYCFLWRLISVRRVRASNGRQNRFLYRSHRNGQSRKNIVFMRLCGVSGIHFLRRGEQIILLFFINNTLTTNIPSITYKAFYFFNSSSIFLITHKVLILNQIKKLILNMVRVSLPYFHFFSL